MTSLTNTCVRWMQAVPDQNRFLQGCPRNGGNTQNYYRLTRSQYWDLLSPAAQDAARTNLEDFGPWGEHLPAGITAPERFLNLWTPR